MMQELDGDDDSDIEVEASDRDYKCALSGYMSWLEHPVRPCVVSS